MNGTLLVDWKSSDDALLVTLSDSSDSNSDTCHERAFAGRWGSDFNGDDELEQKPIVSYWKTRQQPSSDEGITGGASSGNSDREIDLPDGSIKHRSKVLRRSS